MYFEINVSLNGEHFFATAERSIQDRAKLRSVLEALVAAFPTAIGYEINVTKWINQGEPINVVAVLRNPV